MAHPLLFRSLIGCRSQVTLTAVLVASTMTGCIFTDPINAPPKVKIDAPAPIFRGDAAEFSATATDDQQEPPVLTWGHRSGPCPDDRSPAQGPTERSRSDRYKVLPSDTGARFCVWAFATDSHGAVGVDARDSTPANHPPVAQIEVLSPAPGPSYRLFSEFRLSGARSSDLEQDPLVFMWKPIRAPAGAKFELVSCEPAGMRMNQEQCFSADTPGEYKVGLTVVDPFDDSMETVQTLFVLDDQAPCLSQTMPSINATTVVHQTKDPVRFEVSRVDDDGDPWPGGGRGQARFDWAWARGDESMMYLNNRDLAWFDFPGNTFKIGDTVRVRVEVSDRNRPATERILLSCMDQDVCAARPGCFQRVTWKIEYR